MGSAMPDATVPVPVPADDEPDPPPARADRAIGWRTRAAVWDRCGGRCAYCGAGLHPFSTFTIDHITPRSAGGTNALENLVGACLGCNAATGDAIPLPAPRRDGTPREVLD